MYVPDDKTLGNPGIFGFIGKAVTTVANVLTGKQTIKIPQVPAPTVNVQLPPGSVPQVPSWLLPVGIGVAALVLLPMLTRGRR